MVEKGARQLRDHVDNVNALNVFPVPDGDTGTNMNLTLTSGVEELRRRPSEHIGKAAEALAKGLLMGARGNSGVILSQLFRGFAKSAADRASIDTVQFAAALQHGVDLAYKAVVKPVEGTILTVSKEAAKHAVQQAKRTTDLAELMGAVRKQGQEALSRTPDLLPVLKQVGVVDAGGQGLLYIYEGFWQALLDGGEEPLYSAPAAGGQTNPLQMPSAVHAHSSAHTSAEPSRAQAKLATEDIEFGYCTEFMVVFNDQGRKAFDEGDFRRELSRFGDSLLVVADEDLVKVHIHAEYPGSVMNHAMQYGALSRIKIENMREQHSHILLEEAAELQGQGQKEGASSVSTSASQGLKPYGFVAVSAGAGISKIMTSLGVDQVLHGGQTMNPSTEDIVNAVARVQARTVFVLPNNSNIILAAQQAADLVDGKKLIVIPTKSIPQGIAAVIAYREGASADVNAESMEQAIGQVQSGLVTYAVRDTQMEGIDIRQGDYLALHNGSMAAAAPDLLTVSQRLIDRLVEDGAEIVTVYAGEEAAEEQTHLLVRYIEETYKEIEVEVHSGGQPLYYYIISAE